MFEINNIEGQIQKGCNNLDKNFILNAINLSIPLLVNQRLTSTQQLYLIEILLKGIREFFRLEQANSDSLKKRILKLEEENAELKKRNLECSEVRVKNAKLNNELIQKENTIVHNNDEILKLKNFIIKFKEENTGLRNVLQSNSKALRECEDKYLSIINVKSNKGTEQSNSIQNNESIEILSLENVDTLYDESLRYKEDGKYYKISIYIQESNNRNFDKVEALHKYHLYNCRTIQEMKSLKQDFKYCVSKRSDNYFKYRLFNDNELIVDKDEQELYLCKNCLSIYNKQYKNINKIKIQEPEVFNQKKLLNHYIKNDLIQLDDKKFELIPSEYIYDFEQIPNIYSNNWKEISRDTKNSKGNTCEECQWHPKSSEQNKYLHVHHINFRKFDNNPANLKVLCIDCHSNQPNHKHIKKSEDWKVFNKIK